MSTAILGQEVVGHPYIPGWTVTLLSILALAGHKGAHYIDIPREKGEDVGRDVYSAVEQMPARTVVGLDLRGISLMPSFLWRQLGPLLHSRVIENGLGTDKRILYLTGGDDELLRNLRWAFLDASKEASTRAGGKLVDKAALVPAAPRGYCGVLRQPYVEVLDLVIKNGSITNEEVVEETGRRYTFNNANNYLTGLAELGLIYRQVTPRPSGGYASRAYSVSVSEEAIDDAFRHV
jgi:hypothetical protein